jgi:hypothetical protein
MNLDRATQDNIPDSILFHSAPSAVLRVLSVKS